MAGHMVELRLVELRAASLLDGDAAWEPASPETSASLQERPVETFVVQLRIDDRAGVVEALRQIAQRPNTRVVLATTSDQQLFVADLLSVSVKQGARPGRTAANNTAAPLSGREMQVLKAIRTGHTNREIAYSLGISLSTANKHVENVLRKLSVRNRTQAAAESNWISAVSRTAS
jgi:DNA-binding CsgD family transcriptional regulator